MYLYRSVDLEPPANSRPWWTHPLVLIGAGFAILAALPDSAPAEPTCGVCGRPGHNRTSCPHNGPRVHFSRAIPKRRRCDCCGQAKYKKYRHHPRGRSDDSDFLDVCYDCHLYCCHDGDFHNIGIKPRDCRVLNRPSFWRT
jgi:hypothetical protein